MSAPVFVMSKRYRCAVCGSQEFSIYRRPAGHTGAACTACGKWLKWLGRREIRYLRLPDVLPESPITRGNEKQQGVLL